MPVKSVQENWFGASPWYLQVAGFQPLRKESWFYQGTLIRHGWRNDKSVITLSAYNIYIYNIIYSNQRFFTWESWESRWSFLFRNIYVLWTRRFVENIDGWWFGGPVSWSGFTLGAGAVLDLKRFNTACSGRVGSATGGAGESMMSITSSPHGRHLETRRQKF